VEVMMEAPRTGAQNRATVQDLLVAYGPQVQAIVWKLRDLVLDVFPEAVEHIFSPARLLGYGLDSTYRGTVCVVMPLKTGVNLGLPWGIELPDAAGLLVGTGKRARHVRISNIQEAERPAVLDLLQTAPGALAWQLRQPGLNMTATDTMCRRGLL
jgi:hypothetical protein